MTPVPIANATLRMKKILKLIRLYSRPICSKPVKDIYLSKKSKAIPKAIPHSKAKKKNIKIKPFKIIALQPEFHSKFGIGECLICKVDLTSKCIECSSNEQQSKINCTVSHSNCGCIIHTHCIDKILKNNTFCPGQHKVSKKWVTCKISTL